MALRMLLSSRWLSGAAFVAVNEVENIVYLATLPLGSGEPARFHYIDGGTDSIQASVDLEQFPGRMLFDSLSNALYVPLGSLDPADTRISAFDATTPSVDTMFALGYALSSFAVDGAAGAMYVGVPDSSEIVTLDLEDGSEVRRLSTSTAPGSIAVGSAAEKLYYAAGDHLHILDIESNNEVGNIQWGIGGSKVVLDAETDRIYVLSLGHVLVFDSLSNKSIGAVEWEYAAIDLAVNTATHRLYATTFCPNPPYANPLPCVIEVDPASNSVVAEITLFDLPNRLDPMEIAVDPVSNRVFVTAEISRPANRNTVLVIDGATRSIVGDVPVGEPPPDDDRWFPIKGIDVNPVTGRVYVTSRLVGASQTFPEVRLNVIDGNTAQSLAVVGLNQAIPFDVAANTVTNVLYVTGSAGLTVVDGVTNTIITTTGTAGEGTGVAVNAVTNHIYTTSRQHDSVDVFDGATSALEKRIPVNGRPTSVAVNEETDRVYVTDILEGEVLIIGPPFDTDADGVPDPEDICPATPAGESVDEDGCAESQKDDDRDGVTNDIDECPLENALGFDVDTNGCIDSASGLADTLEGLAAEGMVDQQLAHSLLVKLDAADASIDRDKICAAIGQVIAFMNQMNAQIGKKVSQQAGNQTIEYAQSVISFLEAQPAEQQACGRG